VYVRVDTVPEDLGGDNFVPALDRFYAHQPIMVAVATESAIVFHFDVVFDDTGGQALMQRVAGEVEARIERMHELEERVRHVLEVA
jgi:hypothetical protein